MIQNNSKRSFVYSILLISLLFLLQSKSIRRLSNIVNKLNFNSISLNSNSIHSSTNHQYNLLSNQNNNDVNYNSNNFPFVPFEFNIQSVSSQVYTSAPIIWKFGGAISQLTTGGQLITIVGDYWQNTGNCSPDVQVTFEWDYSDGRTADCAVQSFSCQSIICKVPAGVGTPHIKVRSCGYNSADLPMFPQDFVFWPNATLPYNVNWCTAITKTSGTSEATLWNNNYVCSKDTKAKKEYTSFQDRTGFPIFNYAISQNAPANDGLPNNAGTSCNFANPVSCISLSGLNNDNSQQAGWTSGTSYQSRICLPTVSTYTGLQWSTTGAIPGKNCLPIIEPASALNFWTSGQAQLCLDQQVPFGNSDTVLRYHYAAPNITSIPTASKGGPTTGGTLITLYGTSFANATYSDVTIGPNDCPVVFGNSTTIICTLPAGSGQNLLIYVIVDGVSSITPQLFSYDPPVIYSIFPPSIPTQGGATISITGLNFGTQLQPSVTVNGLTCNIDPNINIYNNTFVSCQAPPGQGVNIPVIVTASFRSSTSYTNFKYDRPTIYSILPQPYETVGNVLINVNGTSMGSSGTITIGGQTCVLTGSGWNDQLIQCILPSGQGLNNSVVVTASSQSNLAFGYNYAAPAITSITWSGLSVTIIGTSFGTFGSILLDGQICSQTSYSARRVVYTAPAGQGLNKLTNITVSGQSSNTVFFSYPPVITAANTIASLHPTSGGVALTIKGIGFGLPAVTNDTINVGSNLCSPLTFQNDTFIQCTLPAGQGSNNVYVTAFGQQSNQLTFVYDPPTLAYISPSNGPTAGQTMLTLIGTNFGTTPAVTVNNQAASIFFSNSTVIFARTPAGSGATNAVKITTNSASTASYNFKYDNPVLQTVFPSHGPSQGGTSVTLTGYNFATFPVIVSVSGKTVGANFQNDTYIVYTSPSGAGNAVIFVIVNGQAAGVGLAYVYDGANITSVNPSAGPTAGGTTITIQGTSFGTSGYASFGGVQATSLFYNSTFILATLPVGMGYAPVTVTSGATAGNTWPFSYNRPVINTLAPSSAQTQGGQLITLTGTDFGQSGTVFIGSSQCPTTSTGTSYGDSQIICTLAPGQGANLSVILTVASQVPILTPLFSYQMPVIYGINPTSGVTQGGNALTITGVNFGLSAIVTFVSLTGPQCTSVGLGQSHTVIQCSVPAGQGLNVPIFINVGNQTVQTSYSYQSPVINTISPLIGPTQGSIPITLTGINFGIQTIYLLQMKSINVTNITSFSHTQIIFQLPRGSGINIPISLSVSSQIATYTGALFRYSSPIISSVSGCPSNTITSTSNCDISGGTILTITGLNFGNSSSLTSVQIGSKSCTQANVTIPDTQIKCYIPSNTAGGFNLNVNVTIDSLTGGAPYLSYAGPIIRASTLGKATGYTTGSTVYTLSSDPTGTSPGDDVTFRGYFFGNSIPATTITYGPVGSSSLYTCAVVSVSTLSDGNSTATCTLSVGVGTNLVFKLQSGLLISAEGSDTLNYPLPVIVASSIRGALNNAKTSSYTGQSTEGDSIYFDVLHVGNIASQIKVMYGPAGNLNQQCTNVQLVKDASNVLAINCLTQPGAGSNLVFQIQAVNQLSAVGSDKYNYVTAPQITSITGCSTQNGNVTADCPTIGGTTITIFGSDFGQSGLSIRIGSDTCNSIVFLSSNQLTCVLSASAGLLKPVTVIVGSLFSRAQNFLSYSKSVITSISGCTDAFGSTSNCPRIGGTNVTITGNNFGPANAIVLVGGNLCTNVSQTSDSSLTCLIASGTSLSRPVLMIQNGGALTVSNVFLSYAQCSTGSYAADGVIQCSLCSNGTYADASGLTACKSCNFGTYGPSQGLTSCIGCSIGTIAPSIGLSVCSNCTAGQFQSASGQSACVDCQAGSFSNITSATQCYTCSPGYYSASSGQSICAACTSGQFVSYSGALTCAKCPAGSIAPVVSAASSCSQCQAGTISNTDGLLVCSNCGPGYYSSSNGQQVCSSCDPGQFSNATANSFCYSCTAGYYSTKNGAQGATACSQCGIGQYVDSAGAGACLDCQAGTYVSPYSMKRSTIKSDCQSPIPGLTSCFKCDLGNSQSNTGSTACTPCLAGNYASVNGSVSCSACPVGSASPSNGYANCIGCTPGSVQPNTGQSSCSACIAGTVQPSSAQAVCINADSGTFANISGLSSAFTCPAGKYSFKQPSDTIGPITCQDCPSGTFSTSGAVQCSQCAAGTYVR